MRTLVFNEQQRAFIAENYLKLSSNDLGKHCKCSGGVILRYLRENGLVVSKEVSNQFRINKHLGKTSLTVKEDDFINQNYLTMPVKRIATALGRSGTAIITRMRQLGLVIPREIIEQRKIDSRIKTGNISFNKGKKQQDYMDAETIARTAATRFKKGNLPYNTKEADGAITIRHNHPERYERPYKFIRLSLGKWQLLHKVNWERVNGPVPAGHCLWCINGDTMNCEPDNWELITRKENRIRNSGLRDLSDRRVANYIATSSKVVDKTVRDRALQLPELITAKRTQLLINRKIKTHGTKQNC